MAADGAFATVGRRFAALLLDVVALTLVMAALPDVVGPYRLEIFLTLAVLYFGGLPLTPLRATPGMWACRIRLCDRSGGPLGARASLLRAAATLGWWVAVVYLAGNSRLGSNAAIAGLWMLFPLPWATALFLARRESLFDLLARSRVVQFRAEPQAVATGAPAQKPGFVNVSGAVLLCVLFGYLTSIPLLAGQDRNRRARIGYAIEQTKPLRESVEAYYSRERRWPAAAALGVPEWTPYRDGGGYRLKPDGVIEISFSVLPELKGHTLTLRPAVASDAVAWRCSADRGFQRAILPGNCRD